MNVIAWLKFEPVHYDSAVQRFNHYTTGTSPNKTKKKKKKKKKDFVDRKDKVFNAKEEKYIYIKQKKYLFLIFASFNLFIISKICWLFPMKWRWNSMIQSWGSCLFRSCGCNRNLFYYPIYSKDVNAKVFWYRSYSEDVNVEGMYFIIPFPPEDVNVTRTWTIIPIYRSPKLLIHVAYLSRTMVAISTIIAAFNIIIFDMIVFF